MPIRFLERVTPTSHGSNGDGVSVEGPAGGEVACRGHVGAEWAQGAVLQRDVLEHDAADTAGLDHDPDVAGCRGCGRCDGQTGDGHIVDALAAVCGVHQHGAVPGPGVGVGAGDGAAGDRDMVDRTGEPRVAFVGNVHRGGIAVVHGDVVVGDVPPADH